MRTNSRYTRLFLGALLLSVMACTGNTVDDGDSADVILEVLTTTVPPIAAARNVGVCSVFTITNSTVTLNNKPKSVLVGTSPLNDIIVNGVTITYTWDDGFSTLPNSFSLGAAVPSGGAGTVTFPPIEGGDLSPSRAGHSASMFMLFNGHTVSGEPVTATGGGVLLVNSCI